jgi:murein DD-endopeptidase MepM/ murein hydrolase activator NlpD
MRRSSARATALTLLLVVVLSLTPAVSLAVTRDDYEDAIERAEEARKAAEEEEAKAEELADQIGELDSIIADVETELSSLRTEIAVVEEDRGALEADIAALEARIAEKQAEIERTQAELEERNRVLSQRACETYKQGDTFFLEMLLNAKSLVDLLARTSYVQTIMAADERIAAELSTTRDALSDAKTQLGRDLETVETKRQEVLAEEKRLESLEYRQEQNLAAQESAMGTKSNLLAETEENAERLRQLEEQERAESQKIAEELAAQASQGGGVYSGEMLWPVPGFYRITSPYGPRICPFHGQENHSGVDVGSNRDPYESISGAPIVAAGDGTVIKASYYSSYGNTVMIDHGDGLVTLYAHQLSGGIKVSAGDYVLAGQRIGTVGSTGNSTGPHLHFEVRVNGNTVDPMSYVD